MRRGFTLVEVLVSLSIIGALVVGSLQLLVTSAQTFKRATVDSDLTSKNAQTMRKICDNLRNAMSITVSDSGKRIAYVMPKFSANTDPVTGQKELIVPVVSDGVVRSYVVDFAKKTVTDSVTNKVIMKGLATTDPEKASTQYGQAYTPFILTSVGSVKAVTVNLIAQTDIVTDKRFTKFKTTIVIHNF